MFKLTCPDRIKRRALGSKKGPPKSDNNLFSFWIICLHILGQSPIVNSFKWNFLRLIIVCNKYTLYMNGPFAVGFASLALIGASLLGDDILYATCLVLLFFFFEGFFLFWYIYVYLISLLFTIVKLLKFRNEIYLIVEAIGTHVWYGRLTRCF